MKYWLSLFLIFGSASTKAQPYAPIFDGNEIYYKVFHSFPDLGYTDSISYKGDSVLILNKFYKEFKSYNGDFYVRSDSANAKIWFIEATDTAERLVFDLDMQINDSIFLELTDGESEWVKVDSVFLTNGRKYVRFNKELYRYNHSGKFKLTFIEGIGPNTGLSLNRKQFYTFDSQLLCAYKDGIQVYKAEDTCHYMIMGIDDPPEVQFIVVKANPFDNFAEFDVVNNGIDQVEVFDYSGKSIIRQHVTSSNLRIDLSEYPVGIYFFRFRLNDEVTVLKMVKL